MIRLHEPLKFYIQENTCVGPLMRLMSRKALEQGMAYNNRPQREVFYRKCGGGGEGRGDWTDVANSGLHISILHILFKF